MPRRTARPFGQSITAQRGMSMLMTLLLIGMLYQWTRNPATWQWLAAADDDAPVVRAPEAKDAPAENKAKPKVVENIVPGPNDLVADEVAKFKEKLPLVTDNTPLKPREMSAYWQLMGWARTEPIKQFEKR